jgi:hypothetical protein
MRAECYLSMSMKLQHNFFNVTHPPSGVRRLAVIDNVAYTKNMAKHR